MDAEWDQAAPSDDPVASTHASLNAQKVRTALAALSPRHREAIELAYFGGRTHGEVAELLQVPVPEAITRLSDGLRKLRDVLSPV